jgi:serine/threonine-protein kinase RsbW
MDQRAEREMELTLPMIPDIEIAAVRAAGDLARHHGLGSSEIDEMSHAIIEACINAREHACCADQRIYLRFTAGSTDHGDAKFDVWITDHGHGFDPERERAHRAARPSGPQKRGWGLKIMEAHMDEVEILSGPAGTTIHMVKYGRKNQND